MLTPHQIARAALLMELQRRIELWDLPPIPPLEFPRALFRPDGTPAPPRPAECPPPVRTAVLPALTPAEDVLLTDATTAALHNRSAWQREAWAQWETQRHARRNHGWATCLGDGCPVCALGIAPRTDRL